jgi:hypothetical protein
MELAKTKVQVGFPTMAFIFVFLNKNIRFIDEIYQDLCCFYFLLNNY